MNILDRIVSDTRDLLVKRKRQVSLNDLEALPHYSEKRRGFAKALQSQELAFITEIKKASPSKGIIREEFDPVWISQRYSASGSSAISVLTEPIHFQGSLDYLAQVRASAPLPLLRKDFIFDPYQLYEARAYGADAVLLIVAILDRHQLSDLHQAAESLGLDCLVELYEESELDRVDLDQVRILGVNNRDLRTFTVDLSHSVRLFDRFPQHVVRISESGIYTVDDLHFLRQHDTDAVLIGESLMRAPDPGDQLQALISGLQKTSATSTN